MTIKEARIILGNDFDNCDDQMILEIIEFLDFLADIILPKI